MRQERACRATLTGEANHFKVDHGARGGEHLTTHAAFHQVELAARYGGLVLAFAALGLPARADELAEARRLSASPDHPVFSLGWRSHLHATVGAELSVFGADEPGFFLRVPAMVELHNVVDNAAPNNLWRGLLGVELGHRFARWSVALLIQHESDHETADLARHVPSNAAPAGFYQLNSVGMRADWPLALANERVVASATARLHVFSCTIGVARCADGVGSRAFEAAADLVWSGRPGAAASGTIEPLIAFHADWLVPAGLVRDEHRFILDAGACLRTKGRGMIELVATGWLGSEVGYIREQRVRNLGVALRWTP
jgi:hypothetical protein